MKSSDAVHIFGFLPDMPFLEKFGPKCQNCQFKVKFDTEVNSNMHNPMMVFTFFFFCRKCFFGQIWSKISKWSI